MKGKKARARHHTGPVFAVAYGLRELDKHREAFSSLEKKKKDV